MFALISMEAIVLVFATGASINTITAPILSNLDFLWLLTKSNLHAGIVEVINQPVLIIGHSASSTQDFQSALYYYPVNSILHVGLAWLISIRITTHRSRPHKYSFIAGCALFLVTINYVWLAACCGASPGWTFDTLFLNYVMSTDGTPIQHMDIYETAYQYMLPLQLVIMIVATMMIWRGLSSDSKV